MDTQEKEANMTTWTLQTWSGDVNDGNSNYCIVEGDSPQEALLEAQAEGLIHVVGGMHILISPTAGAVKLEVDEFWVYSGFEPEVPQGDWYDLMGSPV